MHTTAGNVHHAFLLKAIISLTFMMCHLDLWISVSHHFSLCDTQLLVYFMRQLLKKETASAVMARCHAFIIENQI